MINHNEGHANLRVSLEHLLNFIKQTNKQTNTSFDHLSNEKR
jgi:hypothetical protein